MCLRLKAAETGDYAFCIDNSFSHFANKVVFFELYMDTDDEDEDLDAELLNEANEDEYVYKLDDFKVTSI